MNFADQIEALRRSAAAGAAQASMIDARLTEAAIAASERNAALSECGKRAEQAVDNVVAGLAVWAKAGAP